ncbi:MAG TPA: adenylate/guanylate cyclase domain-containing protein [Actinomycetota bacterium]|nr:adenylate/guanylate cyclase domain-containing protein [Actinomycetota bacterium]
MSDPTTSGGSRWLAWGLGAVTLVLTVAGYVFLFFSRDVSVSEVYGVRGGSGVLALPFAATGALLAARRSRNPIGWMLLGTGLLMGFVVFGESYATYSYAGGGPSLPLTDPIGWAQNWMWVPGIGLALVYPFLLFPDGRLPSKRWRWFAWGAPPVLLGFALLIALAPGQLQSVADGYTNPYTIEEDTVELLLSIVGLPFLAVIVVPIVAMAGRFRRSTGDEHEQMKWLLFAGALTAVFLLLNLLYAIVFSPSGFVWQVIAIGTQVSLGGIAAATAVAVLKYRLYEIEVVINRAVVFALVAVFITVSYVGIVVGVGALVGSWGGSSVALPIVATAFVGVAFNPVWQRANALANRFVYGKRRTPYEALSAVVTGTSLEELLPQIARVATESTAARRSVVWLSTGLELRPAASWPDDGSTPGAVTLRPDEALSLPDADHTYSLIHQGDLLGAIAVRTGPGERLPPADNRLLSDLAAQASVTLHGVLEAVPLPTGIVTFLMTDVEGSTRLWEEDAGSMAAAMRNHDALIRQVVRDHGGVLIKWRGEGDSTFSVFTSATDAIAAANAIQGAIAEHRWPTPRPLSVRAALNTGEAELRERDYFGPTVNRCARLRAIADGGQTLVSAATRELARDSLPPDLALHDLGERQLKDVSGTERVYELRRADVPSTSWRS